MFKGIAGMGKSQVHTPIIHFGFFAMIKKKALKWTIWTGSNASARPLGALFQRIKRAFDSLSSLAQHMGVDHGSREFVMSQKALDCPDISACLQKMCRKRMAIMRS